MKKIILVLLITLLLFGCNKKPSDNQNETNNHIGENNSTEVIETKPISILPEINETDMISEVTVDGKKIDLNGNSIESKKMKLSNYLYMLGTAVYDNKIYKNYKSGDTYKVYISDLKKANYDVSKIEELCTNLCNISNLYLIFNEDRKEMPFDIHLDFNTGYSVNQAETDKVYEIAKKIYDSGKYTSAKKEGDIYITNLKELNTIFGYDISEIVCASDTIVEFHPNYQSEKDGIPIVVGTCITYN